MLKQHLVGNLLLGSINLVHKVLGSEAQHRHVFFVFGCLLALLPVSKYSASQERIQLLLIHEVTLEEDLARVTLFLTQSLHKGCLLNAPIDRFLLFLKLKRSCQISASCLVISCLHELLLFGLLDLCEFNLPYSLLLCLMAATVLDSFTHLFNLTFLLILKNFIHHLQFLLVFAK